MQSIDKSMTFGEMPPTNYILTTAQTERACVLHNHVPGNCCPLQKDIHVFMMPTPSSRLRIEGIDGKRAKVTTTHAFKPTRNTSSTQFTKHGLNCLYH